MGQPDSISTADRLSAAERKIDVLQGQVLRAGGEAAVCHADIIELKARLMELEARLSINPQRGIRA